MYNAIAIENVNKPTVVICNEGFLTDGRSAAGLKGMPTVRLVSENVPGECTVMTKTEAGISAVMDDIIAALTKPLTAEEASPQRPPEAKPERVIFKGALEEVNRFFYKRGWTDGLPIVPPTEKAVKEMLTGTDLPADHVVTNIVPRLGKATVEKIAVNAVMAGALPTYLPVLITGVQAIMDPATQFGNFGVSTGAWGPFWVINGPIRHDLHVNSGTGVLSPGDMANIAIGRAMGLIIKNIGGARKGIEDMGVMGNPGKLAMVVAENEEVSPWAPLHVEHGLDKDDSAVTFFMPNSYLHLHAAGTTADGVLKAAVYNLPPGRPGLTCLLVNPTHAEWLAADGWTKEEIKGYIADYARCAPHKHFSSYMTIAWRSHGAQSKSFRSFAGLDSVAIVPGPHCIRVVVAGGPGNLIGLMIGSYLGATFVTKKVQLPANWNQLVKKYKDIVPTHVRY